MVDTFDISNMFAFDMFEGDTKVGSCNVSIHSQYDGFQCPDTWKDKSVLEIDGFGTFGTFQRGGYGRAGLQKCYELSQQMGCEGRIIVHATWGAGSFYEHCGFNSNNLGEPGIKYFEPTSENLEKLFKGGKKDNFSFRENIPDLNTLANFNLDNFSNQKREDGDNTKWEFSLPELDETDNKPDKIADASETGLFEKETKPNSSTPKMTFNPETGRFEYADRNMQKLYDVRKKLHNQNIDPLAVKQEEMSQGLEEIGLSRKDLGKTGNSSTGEITEKHKKIASSQIEDAKLKMLQRRQTKEM